MKVGMTRAKKDSVGFWKEGAFDTVSLFLAAVAGLWDQELLADNVALLTAIGVIADAIVLLTTFLISRYWKSIARGYVKWLLQGMVWITAVLAGNLFTYGYALAFAYPKIGIIGPFWLVVFLLFVLLLSRMIKVQQYRLKQRSNVALNAS